MTNHMKNRYKVSHGEMILDKETMTYLSIEEVCNKLNTYDALMDFIRELATRINEEDNKHERL